MFTNLLGCRLIVECKRCSNKKDREKLREQTEFYSTQWRHFDLTAFCVIPASYSNERQLFYTDDVNEMIAVESIKRSAHCLKLVKLLWNDQVVDASSIGYVKYLKTLIDQHTIRPKTQ